MQGRPSSGQFVFESPGAEAVPSVLYDEHLKLTSKSRMSPFAGYVMPLWYSSIAAEHGAVRTAAGLFDCTHMGVLEVSGRDAAPFLNAVATNDVDRLACGRAQYSYVLDAAGYVLDDIIVYRRDDDRFMVVVNAANEPKIKAYLHDLLQGRAMVDADDPDRQIGSIPEIRDMRAPSAGSERYVDIALQGPASAAVLAKLADDASLGQRIAALRSFAFVEARLGGMDCLVSTTGYTGAKVSFELFVSPDQAGDMWNLILEAGRPLGVLPCGLGARDSLRIEAGLPLYGHELDGPFHISPFEAGYGWAVKLDKDFFIGKAAMSRIAETYTMTVARVVFSADRGVRPVRPSDPVLNERHECIGSVLSCARAGQQQYALVYMAREAAREGNDIGLYYLARSRSQVEQGRKEHADEGQQLETDLTGTVVSRYARF